MEEFVNWEKRSQRISLPYRLLEIMMKRDESDNRLLQTRIRGNVDGKKNKDQFYFGLTLKKLIN